MLHFLFQGVEFFWVLYSLRPRLLTISLWSCLQASDVFLGSSFKVFADALENGGIIKALCAPSGANKYSNTALKKGDIWNEAVKSGAKGLPFLKVLDDGKEWRATTTPSIPSLIPRERKWVIKQPVSGGVEGVPALVSALDAPKREALLRLCSAEAGDLILFSVGDRQSVNKTLDRLRQFVARDLGLVDQVKFLSPLSLNPLAMLLRTASGWLIHF